MKYNLNLATRAYVNRRTLYLSYAVLGALLIIILMFNTLRLFSLMREIRHNRVNIEQIESGLLSRSGVKAAGYNEENYRNLLVSIQRANEILERDSFLWTSFLNQMETVVPRYVRILSVDPDHKDRSVKLSGQAKTLNDLKSFIDNLLASGNYSQVFLESQRNDQKASVINFSIRLEGAF